MEKSQEIKILCQKLEKQEEKASKTTNKQKALKLSIDLKDEEIEKLK